MSVTPQRVIGIMAKKIESKIKSTGCRMAKKTKNGKSKPSEDFQSDWYTLIQSYLLTISDLEERHMIYDLFFSRIVETARNKDSQATSRTRG